jgi:uncharacterized membrane protein YphA (DoxX/SURF4 family)/peroxiredoxin
MSIILLVARLLLAIVFGAAGAAKLFDLEGARRAMREFGAPAPLVNFFALALPIFEIAIALMLLPSRFVVWGAAGAGALLLAFISAMTFSLAKGRAPDCHCFGQIHSAPVSRATIARNVVLFLLAAFVIYGERTGAGISAVEWLKSLTNAERAELMIGTCAVALLAILVVSARRTLEAQREIVKALEHLTKRIENLGALEFEDEFVAREDVEFPPRGLPVGSNAPDFTLPNLNGERISLASLCARGKPLLLLFVSPTCPPCLELLPEVKLWRERHARAVHFALISAGDARANREKFDADDWRDVLLQKEREVAEAYQAKWTPSAVLVDEAGKIVSPLAIGADGIRSLGMKILTETTKATQ